MEYTARQYEMIELLRKKSMSVRELADTLDVSEMTIRRDIAYLKRMGEIGQFRGGVYLRFSRSFKSFAVRADLERDEKKRLAQQAVKYIRDGMLIFIDNSSSCCSLVPLLENFKDITVVTNSSAVAEALGEININVKIASGNYLHRDKCVCGSETEEYIRKYRYDIAFLSASGYDGKIVTSWSEAQVHVRKAVIESSERSVILMTPSKYGRKSKFVLCQIGDAEVLSLDSCTD